MRNELSRRDLLRRGLSGMAEAWTFRLKADERDRFGGRLSYRFRASGFFRLEKADRWWLVTPDGNAWSYLRNDATCCICAQPKG